MRRAHSSLVASILAVSMASSSCTKSPSPAEGTGSSTGSTSVATGAVASGWSGARAAHEAFLAGVPADTAIAATVMVGAFFDAAAFGGMALVPSTTTPEVLRKSLGDASRKDFGIDLFAARSVSIWASSPTRQAFLATVTGPFDGQLAIPGLTPADVGGAPALQLDEDLFIALRGGQILFGNRAGFAVAPAAKDDRRPQHTRALANVPDGAALVTIAIPDDLPPVFPTDGLEAGAIVLSSDIAVHAALVGKAEALTALLSGYQTFRAATMGKLRSEVEGLTKQQFPGSAILSVMAQATLADLEKFELLRQKDPTTLVGATPSLAMQHSVMFIVPVLAAVAIPAFVKYTHRAKTTEAIDQLDKIYKASASYFTAPRVAMATGEKLPCAFPPSAPATPPLTSLCCDGTRGTEGRCNPSASDWAGETWSALLFQMNDPHYFHYAYTSSGVGRDAMFTVSAYADLDCDGEWSTFERTGYGDMDRSGECSMMGSPKFFKEKETE
ncbi:MAG: hypothetical protein IV100_21855 [Myxococcales bacterium]|nr:hypothetical protein [Myxococcales bacterium]